MREGERVKSSKSELLKTAKQIIFNAEMAKAIQDGRKTETRRAINISNFDIESICKDVVIDYIRVAIKPKYKKGDIRWVREPAKIIKHMTAGDCGRDYFGTVCMYIADNEEFEFDNFTENQWEKKWVDNCQGIPNGCLKEMARTFLRITDVRVERLQDMTVGDAINEGIELKGFDYLDIDNLCKLKSAISAGEVQMLNEWITLWNSTSKDGYKWEDSPFVFVYKAEVIEYEDS